MTRTLTAKLKRKQSKQSEKIVYDPRITGPKPTQVKKGKSDSDERVAPVAVTKIIRGSQPSPKVFRVSHRELIGTFNNSTGFVVNNGITGNVYRINPTNGSLFSWLPAIASNFDKYRFTYINFEYVPMCATTETGRVAMYHDPDSQDAEVSDRVELANQWQLSETSPWAACNLRVIPDQTIRFVADSTVTDPKLIDFGQFGFVVYSGAGTNVVGDVFIHYTVELYAPQPSSSLVQTISVGTGAINAGPSYATALASGGTFLALTFRTPGVFVVSLAVRATAFSNFNGSTVTVNSSTVQTGVSATVLIATVTVAQPGQIFAFNGTAIGNYTYHVTRGRVSNSSNLP